MMKHLTQRTLKSKQKRFSKTEFHSNIVKYAWEP